MDTRFSSRLRLGAALALLLLAAPALHAQGVVAGRVTDASDGQPLPGATVILTPGRLGAAADADGRFQIAGVPAGSYTLEARFSGYVSSGEPVAVRSGATTRVDVALAASAVGEAVVEGRTTNLVGVADAASQGLVGQAQIAARPLLRVGEVLETVPGLIVTQHSGSGKANQFFLRGFNLDHGTDFAASLEGVPFNLPTHAHGQGWLDLNSLIPELIDQISFEKGPYDARGSDFASAGSARIRLVRRLDTGIARLEGGTDEFARGLVARSFRAGRGDVLAAVNGQYYNGPWDSPENSTLLSGVAKYSAGPLSNGVSVTALAYHNTWNSTDQIARRAVDAGTVSRLGALDASDGGRTSRYTLVGALQRTTPGRSHTEASAYAAYYDLNLFSNFTYFLDNPTEGDQFEQADRRAYFGANAAQTWSSSAVGVGMQNTLGVDLRHDQIFQVGLFNTTERVRFNTIRDDEVAESSAGLYAENNTQWMPWLRTIAGLRGDLYRFHVDSDIAANSGTKTATIASPKLGVAVGPFYETEAYANIGLGFHSNDARGTTITVDPTDRTPVDRVDPLVRTRGAELGLRSAILPGLQTTLALWTIRLGSELVFVGDAGGTEASDASVHTGVEFNNYFRASDWLNLNLDMAFTRSHYTEGDPAEDQIENSIGRIITGGVYAGRASGGPLASLQLRAFGPRPLTGDGSVRADATTLVNAKVGYQFRQAAVALDVLNLFDSHAADVSYFYPSRLPGEAADGVEDVHVHPVIPITARLSVTVRM